MKVESTGSGSRSRSSFRSNRAVGCAVGAGHRSDLADHAHPGPADADLVAAHQVGGVGQLGLQVVGGYERQPGVGVVGQEDRHHRDQQRDRAHQHGAGGQARRSGLARHCPPPSRYSSTGSPPFGCAGGLRGTPAHALRGLAALAADGAVGHRAGARLGAGRALGLRGRGSVGRRGRATRGRSGGAGLELRATPLLVPDLVRRAQVVQQVRPQVVALIVEAVDRPAS